MNNIVWSVALAATGILGLYMAGNKSPLGWAVSFGAQALWIVFAIVTGQYGFIISAVAYGLVYGRNWKRWHISKAERAEMDKASERVPAPTPNPDWLRGGKA